MKNQLRTAVFPTVMSLLVLFTLASCGSTASQTTSTSGTSTSSATSTSASTNQSTNTQSSLTSAKWTSNVTISFSTGYIDIKSNGIPSYGLESEYILPNQGVVIPTAATSYVASASSSVKSQSYDFMISLTPTKSASSTSTSLGMIGIMIDGAALYNPYEGDNKTVATASNYTIKDSQGKDVAFLDKCDGHPNPNGQYHYHGLPSCITSIVDGATGPSHIIGLALDGFPIYGDRDINGASITASQLDSCNGITSATPEFPQGIYHYVLLNTANASSSIKCFAGSATQSSMNMNMGHP